MSKVRNTNDLKQKNLLDLVKTIRKLGPLTKPQVAKLTNLTSVTVHNFIRELIEKGLVMEVGISKSTGGRKAVLYKINEKFGYIIGVNLGRNYLFTTVYDISLNLLFKSKIRCSLDHSDCVINLIVKEIETAIDALKYDRQDCLGIGITVPGQVNHVTGVIINLTDIPNWGSIPVKSIVENRIGIRTFVDNDINAVALAAKWLGIVEEEANAVIIAFGDGVGAGVLSKGNLFYGSHSNAGEIGHTTIQYNGPKCSCGNKGCIQAFTTDFSIIDRVKKIRRIEPGSDASQDMEDEIFNIIEMVKNGDTAVYEILKEVSFFISLAIEHVLKVYDPEVIVIQSNWLGEFQDLFYNIVDNVFSRCAWAKRDNLRLIVSNIDNIDINGPATMVLERMFTDLEDNMFLEKIVNSSNKEKNI